MVSYSIAKEKQMSLEQRYETPQGRARYQPIEDYAVIGDLYTVALVGKKAASFASRR